MSGSSGFSADQPSDHSFLVGLQSSRPARLPPSGRVAGVDFGTVRIGIAISDPARHVASPLEVYRPAGRRRDGDFFRRLIERESIVLFVVGLPLHMSGDESQKSREARAFGAWLEQETRLPVAFFDERHTTTEAEQLMRLARLGPKQRAERRDMVAAQRILTAFLEELRVEREKATSTQRKQVR